MIWLKNRKLKKFRFILPGILAILLFSLNSCCTKKHCGGIDDMSGILLINFDSSEVENVFIVFYTKDSNFNEKVDSLPLMVDDLDDPDKIFYGHTSKKINTDYDYRLYFTAINNEYTVSSFKTSEAKCNTCFLAKDTYTKLDGYSVNENYRDGYEIKIDKLND